VLTSNTTRKKELGYKILREITVIALCKALSVTIIRKAAITLPRLRMLGHYLSMSGVAFYWLS